MRGQEYRQLAEGYYTVKAIHKLGKSYGVELPICEAVYRILHEGKEPGSILKELFERSLKNEFVYYLGRGLTYELIGIMRQSVTDAINKVNNYFL